MYISVLRNYTVFSLCHLLLFYAASLSQNIPGSDKGESSSTINKNVNDENESMSMIEQQSALCPYIRLCKHTNRSTSTFVSNKEGEYPCCSECSCHLSCMVEGTCCPDFVYDGSELEVKPAREKEAEKIIEGMECVRTHHGSLNKNSDGYQMIASCPRNFTNKAIKGRCEMNIHIYDTDTLVDFIPIFVIESSLSYKNIFCFLCNEADKEETDAVKFQSVTFWNSRIYCYKMQLPYLHIEPDPFMFWRYLLQHGCNIIFYSSVSTESIPKPCTFNAVIETCRSEFATAKLEKICKRYKWPITSMPTGIDYKTDTYKNYACMLCNGRTFSENCFQYTADSSVSSIFLTRTEPAFVANLIENKQEESDSDLININQTINRYFPDSKGNLPCEKGFILDEQKNECRQVLCPENFFLNNGTCFPLYDKTEGIFYFHLFKLIFSAAENVDDTDVFKDALEIEIYKSLRKLIGDVIYNLTLWSNEQEQTKMNQKYFVLVFLDDKHAGGNYLKCIEVFYELQASSTHLIAVGGKGSFQDIYEVKLDFTMNYKIQMGVFVGIAGEVLSPKRPYNGKRLFDSYKRKVNLLHVRISHMCYRIGVAFSDTHIKGRQLFILKRTNKVVSVPNFQRLDLNMNRFIIVCLEYALDDIASANKYIFAENVSTRKPPRKALNHGNSRLKHYEDKNDIATENEVNIFERSIVTIVVTLVVVLIVVGSRMLLKRLQNRLV